MDTRIVVSLSDKVRTILSLYGVAYKKKNHCRKLEFVLKARTSLIQPSSMSDNHNREGQSISEKLRALKEQRFLSN